MLRSRSAVVAIMVGLSAVLFGSGAQPVPSPRPELTIPLRADKSGWDNIHWMDFTPDGRRLAIRHAVGKRDVEDATLVVFDTANGSEVLSKTILRGAVRTTCSPNCAMSPRGEWIAYGTCRDTQLIALPPHQLAPHQIKLYGGADIDKEAPPTQVWVDAKAECAYRNVGFQGGFIPERFDMTRPTPEILFRTGGGAATLVAVATNFEARRVVASFENTGGLAKSTLESWALTEKPKKTVITLDHLANVISVAPDGKTVVAGFTDGSVGLYDAVDGKRLQYLRSLNPTRRTVTAIAFHPGGKHFACGTTDRQGLANLFFVSVTTGEVLSRVAASTEGVQSLRFNTTGEKIATIGNNEIRIWNATALLKLDRD